MPDPLETFLAQLDARFQEALASETGRIARCRDLLRAGNESLYAAFDAGVPITELVHARSQIIDRILIQVWHRYLPNAEEQAALIAVGGYGRGELHPASDVDILILLSEAAQAQETLRSALEALITFLWDMGIEVGQSVRTLEECVREASADVTVITNLLEARWLTGNRDLFNALNQAIAPEHLWDSEAFFTAKLQEQNDRWRKYGNTAYNLEPNIKENPGGLRDIQMIGWVAKRHFGINHLHELMDHGFLTEGECLSLTEGQARLWRIRFQLHRLAKRREDRLLFDYQRTLAQSFGFVDGGVDNLAVEQFMQQYYRTVMELNRLNEMLLQLFQEIILLHEQIGPPQAINKRFQTRSNYLEVTDPTLFQRNPIALLEVFYLLQTHPQIRSIRAGTLRLMLENRHRIDEGVRTDLRARSLFMEILRHPEGPAETLLRMNRYGVLAAYLPAFAQIVGRMQYDLFHIYTVDEHSLRVVRNLCAFSKRTQAGCTLCPAVAQTIPKMELLYIAGLFHDIAKGQGGDHSLLGAREAWDFCQLHGLSEYDSRLVAWLVEKHLLLSMTAQRKDLSDPQTIQTFAEAVGDPTRLDYLYLLTVADMQATNPSRWNAWKDSLLRELYQSTRRALLRGLDNPQAQDELITQKQREALRLLGQYDLSPQAVRKLWIQLSLDYFLHNSPDEIAWQTRLILEKKEEDCQPLVGIRPITARSSTEIFLYMPDRNHLFSRITALLDRSGLSVVDARIITADDGMVLNSYHVLDRAGNPLDDLDQRVQLQENLRKALAEDCSGEIQVIRRTPRQLKHFPSITRVTFSPDPPNQRTIMRLVTRDRPGLLAEVGAAFETCGIRLQNAKIATIGAEVEDVFFITTQEGAAIPSESVLSRLRKEIHRRLEREGELAEP